MLNIQENIILAPFTTFRIGGPAKFFVEVKTVEELEEAVQYAKAHSLKFFVLGGGSNVLVADAGFDGLVIKMKLNGFEVDTNNAAIEVEAGVPLAKLVNSSIAEGMTGMEWATGIPGTVGGAIQGNAGAYGGEMKDVLKEIKVYDVQQQQIKVMDVSECAYAYRNSFFKNNREIVVISAKISLKKGNKETSQEMAREILSKRSAKIPKGGNAGSFFINPTVNNPGLVKEFEEEKGAISRESKLPAGWLIEKVGLHEKKIGGAMVSEIHSNFIVNTGNATAEDVVMLVSLIKQKIRDKFGVEMKEEVQYIGFN